MNIKKSLILIILMLWMYVASSTTAYVVGMAQSYVGACVDIISSEGDA